MIADNNFFNDKIVRVTIKNKFMHLYNHVDLCTKILFCSKEISPPPPPPPPHTRTLCMCFSEYSDILCHMYTVVWDTNPMGV